MAHGCTSFAREKWGVIGCSLQTELVVLLELQVRRPSYIYTPCLLLLEASWCVRQSYKVLWCASEILTVCIQVAPSKHHWQWNVENHLKRTCILIGAKSQNDRWGVLVCRLNDRGSLPSVLKCMFHCLFSWFESMTCNWVSTFVETRTAQNSQVVYKTTCCKPRIWGNWRISLHFHLRFQSHRAQVRSRPRRLIIWWRDATPLFGALRMPGMLSFYYSPGRSTKLLLFFCMPLLVILCKIETHTNLDLMMNLKRGVVVWYIKAVLNDVMTWTR